MSIRFLETVQRCDLGAEVCTEVSICLIDGWNDKTVDGSGIVFGKVLRKNRYIPDPDPASPDQHGCEPLPCTDLCLYQISIEDSQFTENPQTSIPFFPESSDVSELSPFTCSTKKFIAANIAPQTPITVEDTDSVNLTASGTLNHTLSADVNISSEADNILQSTEDGLYVPASAGNTPITPVDSNSLWLSVSGTDDHTITGGVLVSLDPGNSVQVKDDGLYVSNDAPLGSDSLTYDSGTRTFTHTALDSDTQNFYQGIQQIITTGVAGQGVGSDYAVKTASLSGGDLTLRSALEHTTIYGQEYVAESLSLTNVDPSTSVPVVSEEITISNSSNREVVGFIFYNVTVYTTVLPGQYSQYSLQLIPIKVGGSGSMWPIMFGGNRGVFVSTAVNWPGAYAMSNNDRGSSFARVSIPAGGSITIDCRLLLRNNSKDWDSIWVEEAIIGWHLTTV